MKTYTIPLEYQDIKQSRGEKWLIPLAVVLAITCLLGIFLQSTILLGVTLLLAIVSVVLLLYKKTTKQVSEKATTELNKIVQFENGALVPLYQFVIWQDSSREFVIAKVLYDSPIQRTFKNERINHPQNETDVQRNADIDTCRDTFDYLDALALTKFIDERLSLFEDYREHQLDQAYIERRQQNIKHQYTMDELNQLPDAQSVLKLERQINQDNDDALNQLSQLESDQRRVIEHAQQKQKGE